MNDRSEGRFGGMKITERQWETLNELDAACRNHEQYDFLGGWARPMDCGAWDGSHHSQTLTRLAQLGLAERKKRFGISSTGSRGACRYRITDAGRAALAGRKKGGS